MKQQTITKNGISYKMIDRSDEVKKTLKDVLDPTLEALGMQGERHAKEYCPVDTGRLRNSITHATDKEEKAAYIGTNVYYSIPVETGHMSPSGKFVPPKPYIKPAIENHVDEYKAIVKKYLSK